MSDIVTNGGDEKRQGFKRLHELGHWRFGVCSRERAIGEMVRRQRANADEEVEGRLQDIDHVAEVVIRDERVVGGPAGKHEAV